MVRTPITMPTLHLFSCIYAPSVPMQSHAASRFCSWHAQPRGFPSRHQQLYEQPLTGCHAWQGPRLPSTTVADPTHWGLDFFFFFAIKGVEKFALKGWQPWGWKERTGGKEKREERNSFGFKKRKVVGIVRKGWEERGAYPFGSR